MKHQFKRKEEVITMIQYIASDLDGTLLPDGGKHMDPEIFGLMLKLKEKGLRVSAASGRLWLSF